MLTHVYHHDESTPYVTSVTFPMSSTQDTTDLDLRYYGTNLRWVSMLFTHQQCSRYECGQAKKFLDPNSGELYKELQISCNWNRTWSSLESSNRTWTPEDGLHACVWVQCMNPPEVVSHKLSFKQSYFFIFSLLENSTSSPTGRELQLSSLKAWTTLALVRSSILKRTSTNLLGKELIASPMAPGNSWSPGLSVLKVNFNILITDQYSPLSSRQLHISSTWASRTDALGRKSGIWCVCQSVQLFHVNGQVLKHYLPPLCLPIRGRAHIT